MIIDLYIACGFVPVPFIVVGLPLAAVEKKDSFYRELPLLQIQEHVSTFDFQQMVFFLICISVSQCNDHSSRVYCAVQHRYMLT